MPITSYDDQISIFDENIGVTYCDSPHETDALLLLFAVNNNNNKVKMTRKPVKKRKENLVGCTGEG